MNNIVGKRVIPYPFRDLYGKAIEKVYKKAFPDDNDSTLWIVKLQGKRGKYAIYEGEMY